MITGLRTPGIASPLQKRYLTISNKDSIVLRLAAHPAFFPRKLCKKVNVDVWLFFVASNREVNLGIVRPSAHVSSKCVRREKVAGGVVFKSVRRHSKHRWELQRRRYHHVCLVQMIGTASCCCSAAADNSTVASTANA